MNRKWLRVALTVMAVLAALCICAVGLSHIIYGRSVQASVYEMLLRRRFATTRTAEQEVERLEAKRAEGEKPYALPKNLSLKSEITEDDVGGMQVFTLNPGGKKAVLYLHGGAYINGFNAYQWRFMDHLAREADCRVIAPAYHLAPHGNCERAYADLLGLYRGLECDRLILMGDSAGGGLALGLAQALVQAGDPLPERLILFSPWVDVSMENPDIAALLPVEPILHYDLVKVHGQYWADGLDVHDPRVSPLFGDMAGLPPVTVYCGTRELLYPDILLAVRKLADAGVDVQFRLGRGLNHDYPLMPIPEGRRTVGEVIDMVSRTS